MAGTTLLYRDKRGLCLRTGSQGGWCDSAVTGMISWAKYFSHCLKCSLWKIKIEGVVREARDQQKPQGKGNTGFEDTEGQKRAITRVRIAGLKKEP